MKIQTSNNWLKHQFKNGTVYSLFDFIRELYYSKLIQYYAFDVVHDMAVICGKRENPNYIFLKPNDCGTWYFDHVLSKSELLERCDNPDRDTPLLFRITVHPDDTDTKRVSDFNVRVIPTLMTWNPDAQEFQDVTEIESTPWVPLFTENQTKEGK